MPKGYPIAKEVEGFIKLELQNGVSYNKIINNLGVSNTTVYRVAKKYDLIKRHRVPDETRKLVVLAAKNGLKYKSIANIYGISIKTVSRIAIDNGVRRMEVRNDKKST